MCTAYTLRLLNVVHLRNKVDANELSPFNTLCRSFYPL